MRMTTSCFDVFERCAQAIEQGELIESVSTQDKEFHFQNWFQRRLAQLEGRETHGYTITVLEPSQAFITKE